MIDFGGNCHDVKRLNDRTICALCEKEGLFISCGANLILKEDLVNKIVTCKHFGIQVREKLRNSYTTVSAKLLIQQNNLQTQHTLTM